MLLQTNAYFVPPEKRSEHTRLLQRFRHTLARLGCDQFECYEQTGANWTTGEGKNRFIQIMRFRDRKHQQQVQAAERTDTQAQGLIKEFCELINFPYQQQQGYFAVGFYTSVLPVAALRVTGTDPSTTSDEKNQPLAMGEAPEPLDIQSPPAEAGSPMADSPDEISPTDGEHAEEPFPRLVEPENEVATADFGDALDLDKELGLTPDGDEAGHVEPRSTSDDAKLQ